MARWKLACPHYINSPGIEWEYNETINGKVSRKRFPVPRYLNTSDPGDWNNKWGSKDNEEGEIIVCYEGKGEARDIIFLGDPTPDMIPIDDEAKAISKTFEGRWSYRPETAEVDFSQSLVDKFEAAMGDLQVKPAEIPGMSDLVANLAALTNAIAATSAPVFKLKA